MPKRKSVALGKKLREDALKRDIESVFLFVEKFDTYEIFKNFNKSYESRDYNDLKDFSEKNIRTVCNYLSKFIATSLVDQKSYEHDLFKEYTDDVLNNEFKNINNRFDGINRVLVEMYAANNVDRNLLAKYYCVNQELKFLINEIKAKNSTFRSDETVLNNFARKIANLSKLNINGIDKQKLLEYKQKLENEAQAFKADTVKWQEKIKEDKPHQELEKAAAKALREIETNSPQVNLNTNSIKFEIRFLEEEIKELQKKLDDINQNEEYQKNIHRAGQFNKDIKRYEQQISQIESQPKAVRDKLKSTVEFKQKEMDSLIKIRDKYAQKAENMKVGLQTQITDNEVLINDLRKQIAGESMILTRRRSLKGG